MRRALRRSCCAGLAVSLLATGCAVTRPRPVAPEAAAVPSAGALEARLQTRRDALHSLRALARLRYEDPDGAHTSREALIVARPDRLRVEVLSVFGALFVVTADNGHLAAYARQEATVYRGPASPENLSRYARVALPVRELIDVVLATPQLRPGHTARASYDAGVGAVRLSRDLDDGQQSIWFSPALVPVAAEARDADGTLRWRATFAEFEEHGGVPVATHVTLDLTPFASSIDIALEDVDVNPNLDNSLFALQTPPGSKVVELAPVAD